MKKFFKVTVLASAVSLLAACGQEAQEAPAEKVTDIKAYTEDQQAAYAIGSIVARNLVAPLKRQEELGAPLDKEIIVKGITDALNESTQLSDEELQTVLKAYDEKMNTLSTEAARIESEKAEADAENFFAENGKKEGITTTESGLQYEVLTSGTGKQATPDDTVTVHYTGSLLNGNVFDSSVERGEPATFALNRVIPGWTEGVALMNVGSKYKLYIPSELGYGAQGAGADIPPNSTLVFEVELLEIAGQDKK
ncbi:FKBP-type peptidyl-prolyl cis-trans isomerase [Moritella viscosa]|uniref:Peptidyl-prolyl cis-trans isomerase n=1 Tax=Moritella viscosa TaxID=80854 RepID=A0A090IMU6_9GAMM|nr:FKBP-type peptidyl-prolyl cis-trans isomerase [Moritella viscosa]CED61819.1 FKBP-type peptidyl-prolyl cis-trans isomerase FkpA precursor [Moritella viscosa]SGY90965.1 Peptidyl-prolyl cis-trans isomerase [Moritella viscosa]SGZ00114.1 Peptidyl-prolyl cis-trans isomerase [Moritella viscosa]SGZ00672.1 Peptidyl-prolyl cis-trans isomerase [Moritella viscosa]SHO06140.1 Peptidyl-prolyl cis-trans isomerase [Moritella viscosa]